jgi:clan AA aspartic protease
MILGRVLPTGEAVVSLRLRGPRGDVANVEMMIDSGFNDQMTLPPWVIERLALPFRHEATYTLADGEKSVTRIFSAEAFWHEQWRETLVVEMDSDPLLGMLMLHGSRIVMDVTANGTVEISPLAMS